MYMTFGRMLIFTALLLPALALGCAAHASKAALSRYEAAMTYAKNGEYESAAIELEKAVELDGTRMEFYYNLGVAYTYIDGTSGEGEAAYLKAIELAQGALEKEQSLYLKSSFYNLACLYALRGEKELALDNIDSAIDAGYKNYHQIVGDEDLDSLREEDRFKELMNKGWPSSVK